MQSISLASLLNYPYFRSSRLELFCKKDVPKNFAKFTDVSSGTGVSCELCNILKNTFFAEHLQWLLLAFAPIEIFYSNTVCNKSAAVAWICLVSFYGGAKDFIFTCIFLNIITFFINIYKCDLVFSEYFHWIKIYNSWKTNDHTFNAASNLKTCPLFTS